MSRLPAMLATLALLVCLGGCAEDPAAAITPLPRAGSLTAARAAELVEPPMEALAATLAKVPGTEEFGIAAEGTAEVSQGSCVYRSAIYRALSDTSQPQWEKLAAAARPIVEGMGFETSTWVDEHASVGGGLVARATSGAFFNAQPIASDEKTPETFDMVRFFVVVPLDDGEC